VLPPENASPHQLEKAIERTPLKRWGTPDDVARTVVFLCRSGFITGQVVIVDGGQLIG